MSQPLLGVALPSLNAGAYLLEAVASLKALRVPFRASIRDGGSTDGSFEAVRTLIRGDERFDARQAPDGGQAEAIQAAWDSLPDECDLWTWLNADDLLHPHGFSAAVARARSDQRVAAVYGDFLIIDDDGLVIEMIRRPTRISRAQLVYNECLVPGLVPVLRREAVEAVGGLDNSLHYGLDYDLFIRLAAWGSLVRTPHIVASFRDHPGSKTLGDRADASIEESERIRERYRRLPSPLSRSVRTALRAKIKAQRVLGRQAMVERFGAETVTRQSDAL